MTRRRRAGWPAWFRWELVLSDHVERRMEQRGLSDVDLRVMILKALAFEPSQVEGRFVLECRRRRQNWRVVVEPDADRRALVVVTVWRKEVDGR